jgi:serpin B
MKINFMSAFVKKNDFFFKRITCAFVTCVLFLQCCTCSVGSSSQSLNDSGATPEGKASLINANNQFALEFYSHLKNQESEKNVFFSPYSISTALAMTYEGAKGETAEEMQSVFHFSENDKVRRSSVAAIYNELNKNQSDYTLSTANALWVQKDYPLLEEVTKVISEYYGGRLNNLDFIKEAEESRTTINNWIEDETNGKIKDAIKSGALGPLIRIILTNAIYFKGSWEIAFDEGDTQKEDFHVSSSQTVKADMMRLKEEEFPYMETEALQMLEMPYKGDNLSMLVLLSKDNDIQSLEQGLDTNSLSQWRDQLKKQKVDVYIPRFNFKTEYQLKEQLKAMGMPLVFTPPEGDRGADLSGFTENRNLYISFITHLAFVDVNEEGTEAAAATVVGIQTTSISIDSYPVFRADHPFIFLIQEKKTGHILFMGKVTNPNL